MAKGKKSKKRASPIAPAILVVLTSGDEYDKSWDSIIHKSKVGFDIEDIQPGSIPVVRARNHPVQRDPPPNHRR
jgi:hypothetical protein